MLQGSESIQNDTAHIPVRCQQQSLALAELPLYRIFKKR